MLFLSHSWPGNRSAQVYTSQSLHKFQGLSAGLAACRACACIARRRGVSSANSKLVAVRSVWTGSETFSPAGLYRTWEMTHWICCLHPEGLCFFVGLLYILLDIVTHWMLWISYNKRQTFGWNWWSKCDWSAVIKRFECCQILCSIWMRCQNTAPCVWPVE